MISINKYPQTFTPCASPVIFQIESDNDNILYFAVQLIDAATDSVLANQKYYTLPNSSGSTFFDLSSILSNYVDHQLIPDSDIIQSVPLMAKDYNLYIIENVVSGNTLVNGDTLSITGNTVWDTELNRIDFSSFNYLNYTINSVSAATKFLTHKPLVSNLYHSSNEFLYFLNAGIDAKVQFKFYRLGHILLGSHTLTGVTADAKSYRLNVSPAVIESYFGDSLSNMYGDEFGEMFDNPFGTEFGLGDTNYFTVQILDNSNNPKSEIRTYALKKDVCKFNPVHLVFSNDLGGFDGLTMFNPSESITVSKSTIKTFPYQFDNAGNYANIINGVYNATEVVYNVDTLSRYKVYSDLLNADTAVWVKGLLKAKKVFVKLDNGDFLPISITTDSFTITNKAYRFEIEFTAKESGLKF